jgi:hypothetical protein
MAKKPTKSPASRGRSGARSKTAASAKARSQAGSGTKSRSKGSRQKRKPEKEMSASDAMSGILESPLVAEVIAAGAAAALATLTQQAISKKAEGGTRQALKLAAKAATSAMGARLAAEIDEIVASAKSSGKKSS